MPLFVKKTHPTSGLQYRFRIPKYPVLCRIGEDVVGATSERRFIRKLALYTLKPEEKYAVIDVTGEHWNLYPDTMLISPLNGHKRWTKLQVIQLVNTRSNISDPEEQPYSERSLSAKRFDRIFHDLVKSMETESEH